MTQLVDAAAFFEKLAHSDVLGPDLTAGERAGTLAILAAVGAAGWGVAFTAYALATAFHETAGTMQPIRERGGEVYFRRLYDPMGLNPGLAARLGNTAPGDGAMFCGRGYVQLTGRANYAKAAEACHADLVAQPELALQPNIAARILVWGMGGGAFTGKRLATYLPPALAANRQQFTDARRIINGVDRADMIAGYALTFQTALTLGGWG